MNKDLLKLLTEGWLYISDNQMGLSCTNPAIACTECPAHEKCLKFDSSLIPEEVEYLRTHHPELFI